MVESLMDILIEQAQEKEKYFKNYLFYAKEIKKTAEEILGKVKVFVFGSILKKKEVAQDIDILIVSPKIKTTTQKSKFLAELWKKFGIDIPFEFHLINPRNTKIGTDILLKRKLR